jgi:hypothetical protein
MSYHRTTVTTYLCPKQTVAQHVPEQYLEGLKADTADGKRIGPGATTPTVM